MAVRGTSDLGALADRIRQGDRTAEDELVRFHQARVMGLVAARVRDRQLALDITQEVMLRVLGALRNGRLRDHDKLPQYINGTARHLVCENFRGRRWNGTANVNALYDESTPQDEVVVFRERLERVRSAYSELPPQDRGILGMMVVAGLDAVEVARRTGMSPCQVRQRKSRALRKMRAQAGLADPL